MNKNIKGFTAITTAILLIVGCGHQATKPTLRSIDVVNNKPENKVQVKANVSKDEIRLAYQKYLATTSTSDDSRQIALARLAELEFDVTNKNSLADSNDKESEITSLEDERYTQQIKKSIELYLVSLRDYPKAKDNDKLLYQLAKAYDQIGESDKSFETLVNLSEQFPSSIFFIEAQFRIAEYYFAKADYVSAEQAYTDVIISPKNHIFYERALFKRGWSRFKQSYYEDAVDDYLRAVTHHNFDEVEKLSELEKERFDEYFRAIGLTFANLGGASYLNEFFQTRPDYKYLYHTYSVISDIYLKQERYSDSVKVMEEFSARYPLSKDLPKAQLKIVTAWQTSGFSNNLFNSIESFYSKFNLNSKYWNKNPDKVIKNHIEKSLKEYVLLMAEHFHARYQKKDTSENFSTASRWYTRYLDDYEYYARKDNIYFKFAELLREEKFVKQALKYYELAAYDDDLVLDKKSSYLTITLTDKLYRDAKGAQKVTYLSNHIKYANLFAELYPNDTRLGNIIANAAELAYNAQRFEDTVKLTGNLSNADEANKNFIKVTTLKAQSYFKLGDYLAAESAYSSLLAISALPPKSRIAFTDRLALSIYRYASSLKQQGNTEEATHNFMRIYNVSKSSEIAATGLYDAIALLINNKKWQDSIDAIKRFQSAYPKHKYGQDLVKKLSIVYLNSDQKIKAAQQFEKISGFEQSRDVKMTALWQAAELYESNKEFGAAIRSYTKFANTYKTPFAQNMEAMQKLVELYSTGNKTKLKNTWQARILKADKSANTKVKTDRTNYITSITALSMAKEKNREYSQHQLIAPLNKNLRKKKQSMQQAVKLYGRASSYGIAEIATESTFAIAKIYHEFSEALLNSERPNNLKGEELEQYNILLEDQAFPFEDKAIEFYEINLSRIKSDIFDDWVSKSLLELKSLFPVKYARKNKIDGYIEALN